MTIEKKWKGIKGTGTWCNDKEEKYKEEKKKTKVIRIGGTETVRERRVH